MPDLTLDEFRATSKEGLKQMLRKEAIKAGFEKTGSRFDPVASTDSCRFRRSKEMGFEGWAVFLKRLCMSYMGRRI